MPLAYSRQMNDQPLPLTPERIAVVVPALNEALRIRDVVQGALRHCPNVIVVDDGSDDGTADAVADLPVVLLRHAARMGKGAGLRTGFAAALQRGFAAVITMDGDGQHSAGVQRGGDEECETVHVTSPWPGGPGSGSGCRRPAA